MSTRMLNQLPNGIVKSSTAAQSGEVSDINFGGLTAAGMGNPVLSTDGVNKSYGDSNYLPSSTVGTNSGFLQYETSGSWKRMSGASYTYNATPTLSVVEFPGDVVAPTFNGVGIVSNGDGTQFLSNDGTYKVESGGGDVTGPASSISGNLSSFNGTTGKIIQDSGVISANVVTSETATLTNARPIVGLGDGKKVSINSGNMTMGNFRITGVGDAVNAADALNQQTGDARYGLNFTKNIEVAPASSTPIVVVDSLGGVAGHGINIAYDPTTKQFVIDMRNTSTLASQIILDIYRSTSIMISGSSTVNEIVAIGKTTITNMSSTIKYFAEDPSVGGVGTALPADYRFGTASDVSGNKWVLDLRAYASEATSGFEQLFRIVAVQLNQTSSAVLVPTITVNYSYTRVS